MLLDQILSYSIHGKIKKSHTKALNLKILGQRGMKIFELPDRSCFVLLWAKHDIDF